MKKLLCVTLAFLLLLSVVSLPRISAAEDHFELFGNAINSLRWQDLAWDVPAGQAFPLKSVMGYTRDRMCTDEYGENLIVEEDYSYYAYYAIPADVFEAAAMDFFAVVDVEALRSYTSFFWDNESFTGIDDFQNYQPDRHVYLFSSRNSGMGDPSWYEILGYTEEEGLYTVYSRFVSLLGEEPAGEEGVDYIRIGEAYYAIEHYLRTVMAISNDCAQFHSWEEIEAVPDVEMTTPPKFVVQEDSITIEAEYGVFPADTVIDISQPDTESLQLIQQALQGLAADFVAYDITATHQPNGVAQVTVAIPEGFDADQVALFYISDEGVAEQLDAVVNAEAGTLTAILTRFGVYAVAQLATDAPLLGDANRDGAVSARDARLVLQYAAGLVSGDTLDLNAADFNGDGTVNARDARAILWLIAGLTE